MAAEEITGRWLIGAADVPGTEGTGAAAAAPMLNAAIASTYGVGMGSLGSMRAVEEAAHGLDDASLSCPAVAHPFVTTGEVFLANDWLHEEIFGSAAIVGRIRDEEQPAPATTSVGTRAIERFL